MIAGPVLGGSWLGAYYGVGTVVEEPAPEVSATPSPQGAVGPGGPVGPVSHGRRYKGSRQTFVDGEWRDADTNVEEIGAPRKPAQPFEPPEPWTPEKDRDEESEPAHTGSEPLGIAFPAPTPTPIPEPRKRVAPPQRTTDDDALAVLLAVIGRIWG